eukprot:3655091-Alexandrium_andersonii.AAC.1
MPQVNTAVGHMCRLGMRVFEPASVGGRGPPVRKPAHWASSAPEVLKRVGLRCQRAVAPGPQLARAR